MSLIKRLFKSQTAKAPNLDAQLAALAGQSQEALLATARGDGAEALREAAIQQLAYSQGLLQLAQEEGGRWPIAARKRLGQLLEDGQLTLDQLHRDLGSPERLLAIASYSPTAIQQLVAETQDTQLLLTLACDGATTQVRQAAAERIHSRAELEQLCKQAQGRDKSVYKLARARLDVFKAEDAKTAESRAKLAGLCEKLEKLARLEADPVYKARIALLEHEGESLASAASPELLDRYQQALGACRQQITARAELIARAEEESALDDQALQLVNGANRDIQQLITRLYTLTDTQELPDCRQQLDHLQRGIGLAGQRPQAVGQSLKEFERARHHAIYWLEHLERQGSIADLSDRRDATGLQPLLDAAREFHRGELPAVLAERESALKHWEQEAAETRAAARRQLDDIADLARRGLWAARDGLVRKARGIHRELQEKSARLQGIPASLQGKIDELDQAIARLSDWHEFAVTPKKEALVAQMQALAGSHLAPQDLATRIHELQDEWKSLSRGVQQADESLWDAFQEASHQAYAPCREFFDAQARERDANLARRETLIQQLDTYLRDYAWDAPVWTDVEQTLRVARQEWQSCWPVPRKAGEELQTRFEQLMDDLHARLKAHYQDNKATKQALIAEAHACVEDDDLPQAIATIKQLQARWKTIGKGYPRDDQHLWQAFRRECDAVFARRQEQETVRQQARHAQATAARELIARLDALAALPYDELLQARETIAAIKSEFKALGELPRDDAKALAQDFSRRLDHLDKQLVSGRNQAEIRRWQDLYALADQLRTLEVARLQGRDTGTQAAGLLDNPPPLPPAGLARLQERLAAWDQLTSAQQTENAQQLRLLCIRAEILSGQETPSEDKTLRMEYQMKQLQQGLGQGQGDRDLEDLALEWVGLGGVEDSLYQPLFTRFMQSLARKPGHKG